MDFLYLKICKLIKLLFKKIRHIVQTRDAYMIFKEARLAQTNNRITRFLKPYLTSISFLIHLHAPQ